jgi:hypothetical protein
MEEDNREKKDSIESFTNMFKEFGEAVSEIFNDPRLRQKAREFNESAFESAKALGDRFKDEDVKNKFKDVGKAAQEFGRNVRESFEEKKNTGASESYVSYYDKDLKVTDYEEVEKEIDLDKKIEEKIDEKIKEREQEVLEKEKKVDQYITMTRGGRVAGYSIAIFWNIAFLIFFNFYYDFIAVYTAEARIPIITGDWAFFLPILNVALIVSIIGNIILIIYDRYELKQIIDIVTMLLGVAVVITLLNIFPFNFNVIPHEGLSIALTPIMTLFLIILAVGLGVGVLIRFIKLVMHMTRTPR